MSQSALVFADTNTGTESVQRLSSTDVKRQGRETGAGSIVPYLTLPYLTPQPRKAEDLTEHK